MIKQGKSKDTAVLRTLINTQAQNFATKRLLKDLNILEKESIPTVGVTARPLEHDLFVWHANIRGPVGTPYEGGIFHIELLIPQSYPHQPPEINLFTKLPHPNVFGQKICLDLLQPRKPQDSDKQSGWSSAYSIQSILLQLQAFLFEENITEKKEKQLANIKKAVLDANNYKCTTKNCKHGGKLSLWPQFNQKETDDEEFLNKKTQQELLEADFACFHTKLRYKKPVEPQNDDETKIKQESCLGVLLNITKVPRTGQIKQAVPSFDYISIKAFLNEGIKWDSLNITYTHWLPIYFGKTDNKERVLHLLKKSLSMIMTNNTRRFKPEFVLEVFPKITQTIVHALMSEKAHASIRLLRILSQVHALWLLCMEEWPQLYDQVDQILTKFITDEKSRNKDQTPNLGILFNLLYVSKTYKFEDLVVSYTAEQLDRQVFWLLKEIPELADEKLGNAISAAKRVEITFKQQATSFQMGCFQYLYLNNVIKPHKSLKELWERFDNNYCLLSTGQENAIQQRIFDVFKTIINYDSFYEFIGQQKKTIEELNLMLKQAVKNSKEKNYHGTVEEMNKLPPSSEQVKQYQKKFPQLQNFFQIEKVQTKQKNQFEYKITSQQNVDWKEELRKRWEWIDEELKWNPNITATQLANISNFRFINDADSKPVDRLSEKLKKLREQYSKYADTVDIPEQNWKQVFMKLDFEQFIAQLDDCPDFQSFYEKLEIIKPHISDLIIPITHLKSVSSGYYYITALLESLTNLENLTITGLNSKQGMQFPNKAAKAIFKGLSNLNKKENKLHSLSYYRISFTGNQTELSENLLGVLNLYQNSIKSFAIQNSQILTFSNAAKIVGGFITCATHLEKLNFQGSILNANIAKEITDGLMRAKQLTFIDISNNSLATEKGLAQIVYNLSFSPKLTSLNISGCGSMTSGDLVESLYKLLRITASLERLDLQALSQINLNKEFFQALGENRTLQRLNLNFIGEFSDQRLEFLGKAVSFNAKKGGALRLVNLIGDGINYNRLKKLLDFMSTSNYDNELWYGDYNKAQKFEGDNHKKTFACNLVSLDIRLGDFNSQFNLASYKAQYNKQKTIQQMITLFENNQNLVELNLQEKGLIKRDIELLHQVVQNNTINIKTLNLSRNAIGKEGAKILGQILETNKSIQFLDVSGNKIGVSGGKSLAIALQKNTTLKSLNLFFNMIGFDGATQFGETFKVNNSLEFVDLGDNRIRNKGLLKIAEGLSQNKQSKLQTLGLRFNFLSEDGILTLLKQTNLSEIFIKNNSINEYGLFVLKKGYDELKSNVRIDLFSKFSLIEDSRLERTAWVQPNFSNEELISFFKNLAVGVIINSRIRKGIKYENRQIAPNIFNFIEFADPNSLNRALALASTGKAVIQGKAFRIYKAGTGTYVYQKKSAKQKKAETSKTKTLPEAAEGIPQNVQSFRGRGRGRGIRGARGARVPRRE